MNFILSLITFLPLLGAAIITLFVQGSDRQASDNAKRVSFVSSLFVFFLIGVAGVLGIAISYLNGWVFSLALGALTLLILAINSLLTKHRRRKKELDVKGFLLPTREELQSYQDAVDFFDYVSSTARGRFSPVVAKKLQDAAVKKMTKDKSDRAIT